MHDKSDSWMTEELSSVSIQCIEADDARRSTDSLRALRDSLFSHEAYYPGIRHWFIDKVVPDLKTGRRSAFVGYDHETPILTAVLKRGTRAKFCHLSIDPRFQNKKLGHLMFCLMAAEVRNEADEIHFTLPEGLWARENGFFTSLGFANVGVASSQYRLFEEELRCSASFPIVWKNVVAQLPVLLTSSSIGGFRINEGVVLAIHEKHARSVMRGEKTVEVRKRFTDRWVGRKASVYCSGGSGSLLGTVTIEKVTKGRPRDVWSHYASCLACSRNEFDAYVGDRAEIYAIELTNPEPYLNALPLSQLSHLIGGTLYPPQSYVVHNSFDIWGKALSLAAVLHGRKRPPKVLPINR